MASEPERLPAKTEPVAKREGSQEAETRDPQAQELPTTADDLAGEAIEEKERSSNASEIHTGNTTARNSEEKDTKTQSHGPSLGAVHSVIPRASKRVIIILVACAGVFSPMTSAIYLPALSSIADDLKVKTSYVNLTITTCTYKSPRHQFPDNALGLDENTPSVASV